MYVKCYMLNVKYVKYLLRNKHRENTLSGQKYAGHKTIFIAHYYLNVHTHNQYYKFSDNLVLNRANESALTTLDGREFHKTVTR